MSWHPILSLLVAGVVCFTLQWVEFLSINIANNNEIENKMEFITING